MRSKPDVLAHMPFALISCFCFSGALVWSYSQTGDFEPWLRQGVRVLTARFAKNDSVARSKSSNSSSVHSL
jgi:hypothetical protein